MRQRTRQIRRIRDTGSLDFDEIHYYYYRFFGSAHMVPIKREGKIDDQDKDK